MKKFNEFLNWIILLVCIPLQISGIILEVKAFIPWWILLSISVFIVLPWLILKVIKK